MSASSLASALQSLQTQFAAMPPVLSMGVAVDGLHAGALRLRAPLQVNVNDKANAFGGSLASLMTLASWGWLTLQLQLAGHPSEVYVADSQLRYVAPVYEDLVADAQPAEPAGWDRFLATFRQRGKARIDMRAQIAVAAGAAAATLSGRFVAFPKRYDAP
ncbi:YiiD C-terminal domain-containing protein [Xanthomonas maliensis]|uniref:YiiD C-terminal domain-containing protein n=1 Tax=Xanthomonas maliensis TaxID=1321368 RepID=UPI0003A12FEF|nr:YiiD C-terminal domain-containing protein [Xanthomonas maliensis]KAB7769792.1 thioesterase [Xanthomonas maliensis]